MASWNISSSRINFHSETSFTDIFYISIQNEWCYIDWQINNQADRSNLSILRVHYIDKTTQCYFLLENMNTSKILFSNFKYSGRNVKIIDFSSIYYSWLTEGQNEWCYIDWQINNQADRSNLSILTILMPVSRSVWIAKRLNWLKLLFITFSDDIFVSLRMDFITSILTTNWPVGRQYDSNQQVT
jgi:hypothetical protein